MRRIVPRLVKVRPDVVLFEAWRGKYADNPRAISEELRRRDAPFQQVWVAAPDAAGLPEGVTTVAPGSGRYLEYLGRARYIVSNNNMPGYFRKKRGTTYLQTWHGTPLKRIAFDIERPAFQDSTAYLATLAREVKEWDFLVSPNPFSTDVFRRAFRYDGAILETGYPRNDILSAPDADLTRTDARERLGLAPDARAILYAPTWRDDDTFALALDLDAMARDLPDADVVLLRTHHLVAKTVGVTAGRRIRDVSAVADIRELYLAADVLITDYSSVMFDFGVTGKPMIFFAYDIERYRDELRGFYFDFEETAPGPVLTTTGEVIEALRDLEAVAGRHEDSYARFRERFCALEDGAASKRVVDSVFGV